MNAPETTAARFTLTTPVTITPPPLAAGELWAGIVTTEKGLHHIILLPGDQAGASWKKQMAWAASIGGDLPDRVELATLRRTLPEEFEPDLYWSGTQHAVDSDSAWYQDFYYGWQDYHGILTELRARAVRRIAI